MEVVVRELVLSYLDLASACLFGAVNRTSNAQFKNEMRARCYQGRIVSKKVWCQAKSVIGAWRAFAMQKERRSNSWARGRKHTERPICLFIPAF